ncbi:MAG: hypothetical protein VX834_08510 [Myxococcota bacterium]|nr:hypothetical protein [Myxococcota bacterium]
MSRLRLGLGFLLVFMITSCGPRQVYQKKPMTSELWDGPGHPMPTVMAEAIVADLEARLRTGLRGDPLLEPKTLDDVESILKRDNLGLFQLGVQRAAQFEGARSMALRAQMELAWGEAQDVLAEMFLKTATVCQSLARVVQDEGTSRDLRKTMAVSLMRAAALNRVSQSHVAEGTNIALHLLETAKDDYVGYRIAADYLRMNRNWQAFERTIKKLEDLNPDSNGLKFQQAVVARVRQRDLEKARTYLMSALEKDPDFIRARIQLMLAQGTIEETSAQLKLLGEQAPSHQVVVFGKVLHDYERMMNEPTATR